MGFHESGGWGAAKAESGNQSRSLTFIEEALNHSYMLSLSTICPPEALEETREQRFTAIRGVEEFSQKRKEIPSQGYQIETNPP